MQQDEKNKNDSKASEKTYTKEELRILTHILKQKVTKLFQDDLEKMTPEEQKNAIKMAEALF